MILFIDFVLRFFKTLYFTISLNGISSHFGRAILDISYLIIVEISSRIFHFNAIETFTFRNYP